MQDLESRMQIIESRLEEQEEILHKLWRRSQRSTRVIGRVEMSCMAFLGFLLIVSFGIQIKTEWFDFDLSGETLAKILELAGVGAIAAPLAKWAIDKTQNTDDE